MITKRERFLMEHAIKAEKYLLGFLKFLDDNPEYEAELSLSADANAEEDHENTL